LTCANEIERAVTRQCGLSNPQITQVIRSNPGYLRIKRLRTIECRVTARSKMFVSFTIERRA